MTTQHHSIYLFRLLGRHPDHLGMACYKLGFTGKHVYRRKNQYQGLHKVQNTLYEGTFDMDKVAARKCEKDLLALARANFTFFGGDKTEYFVAPSDDQVMLALQGAFPQQTAHVADETIDLTVDFNIQGSDHRKGMRYSTLTKIDPGFAIWCLNLMGPKRGIKIYREYLLVHVKMMDMTNDSVALWWNQQEDVKPGPRFDIYAKYTDWCQTRMLQVANADNFLFALYRHQPFELRSRRGAEMISF